MTPLSITCSRSCYQEPVSLLAC